ncbi:hypothetical protein QQ045_019064 [Rhodiola kirilowii]
MARVEMSVVIIFVFILGTYTTPTLSAFWNFPACYERCMVICAITNALPVCVTKCAKDCIKRPLANQSSESYDCTMKCATSKCMGISAKDDPRAKEVNHCLDACSTSCSASN